MKAQLIMLVLFFTVLNGQGQQVKIPPAKTYDSLMIHHYSGTRWMVGNRIIKKKELRALLRSNAASAPVLNKANKKRVAANVISTVAWSIFLGSYFVIPVDDNVAGAMVIGSLAGFIGSIPFYTAADRGLHEAVWLYNRAILTGDTLHPRPPMLNN